MSQSITFADAYNLQIRLRESQARILSNLTQRISEEEISTELTKVVSMLEEERNPALLRQIKGILKQIPPTFSTLVGSWVDNDGLDILHHSIINNCPEIVEFLLSEPNWFPQTLMPKKNPYAHLAAMFGFCECLRQILQFRPVDYFSGSNQNHIIKLPATVRKKLKPIDTLRSNTNKQVEKLMHKIKSTTETAEIAMQHFKGKVDDINDVTHVLTGELEALEKSGKDKVTGKKKRRDLKLTSAAVSENVRESLKVITESPVIVRPKHHSLAAMSKTVTFPGQDIISPLMQKIGKMNDLKIRKRLSPVQVHSDKKHKITVFWDVFSEAPEGVVKGAGSKINMIYTENVQQGQLDVGNIEPQKVIRRTSIVVPPKDTRAEMFKSQRQKSLSQSFRYRTGSATALPKVLEPGIRGRKKYKDFVLNIESQSLDIKDEWSSLRNKTPLSLAAQHGHLECVKMILETFILKNYPSMAVKEPITLATKAKSPDAIVLLMDHKVSRTDYQSAVLIAIREMYPDCLTALLIQKNKERQALFDGINLFHILYTQSLMSEYRYEMLPLMTNVLINSNEDVNAHNVFCTYPMYTLINCAFNITTGKKIFYYVECLKILLENKANPHFDEGKAPKVSSSNVSFTRSPYSSAINCILESAVNSVNFFESSYWSKLFMKKMMTTVTTCDRTNRRLLNDVLFNYMNTVCSLNLDRYIVRCLLRYGANADFRSKGKYAINVYFDNVLPYLAKFEVNTTYSKWQQEISALMLVCRCMSHKCLKEAQIIFLNEHLLQCPIQALPLCRYFSYLINNALVSPRPLVELAAQYIWVRLRRNEKRVKTLPLPENMISLILP